VLVVLQIFEYNVPQFPIECPKGDKRPAQGQCLRFKAQAIFESQSRLQQGTEKERMHMRVILAVVLGFGVLLSAQSIKDKKIEEIDKRIAALQQEIEGLQALKSVVSSGQLPESALNQIVVGSTAVSKPSSETPGPPVFPGSKLATSGQSAAPPPANSSPGSAQSNTAVQQTTPSGAATGKTTTSGQPIYEGPRGGLYHYSASGKKVYEKKK
jgi:hypothetical protein